MSATAHLTENGDGTVLSISDLTVRFAGAPANVVDGVSFSVKRGKTLERDLHGPDGPVADNGQGRCQRLAADR
nr:hypothetical protein [Pseudomonas viridiflava]